MIKKYVVLVSVLLGAGLLHAETLRADWAEQLKAVKTARSHFTEEKHLSLFTAPVVSEGEFVFDRAAQKLRWEYTKPFAKGFIIEGKKVFRMKDGQKTAVKNAMGKTAAAQMLVWLTLDLDELAATYRIAQENNTLIFTPLTPNEVLDFVSVKVDTQEKIPRVRAVKIAEKNGDYTLLNFTGSVLNGAVADGDFR